MLPKQIWLILASGSRARLWPNTLLLVKFLEGLPGQKAGTKISPILKQKTGQSYSPYHMWLVVTGLSGFNYSYCSTVVGVHIHLLLTCEIMFEMVLKCT